MAGAESSAAASKHSTGTAPKYRPQEILDAARELRAFKARSKTTAMQHLADVEKHGHEVRVALLGDSMIERMESTGDCQTLHSWPSETMASDRDIQAMNTATSNTDAAAIGRLQGVANFGCGGDKIQNVLYRVVSREDADLKGLAEALQPSAERRRDLKLWVIQVGTNNLHRKHGLREIDLNAFDILLQVLHTMSGPGTKFLVTGLFYRRDIPRDLVDQANVALQNIVARLARDLGTSTNSQNRDSGISTNQTQATGQSVHHTGMPASLGPSSSHDQSPPCDRDNDTFRFLPAPRIDEFNDWLDDWVHLNEEQFNDWLDDHVHLNEEGYRRWTRMLLPTVHEMLRIPRLPGVPHPSAKDERESTS